MKLVLKLLFFAVAFSLFGGFADAKELVICPKENCGAPEELEHVVYNVGTWNTSASMDINGLFTFCTEDLETTEGIFDIWRKDNEKTWIGFEVNEGVSIENISFVNKEGVGDYILFAASEYTEVNYDNSTLVWKNAEKSNVLMFIDGSDEDVLPKFDYIIVGYTLDKDPGVPTLKSREVVFDRAKVIGFDCAGVPSQIARFEGGGNVTYSSSNERVVTVDPNTGYLKVLSDGSATITAKVDATDEYAAAEGSYSVEIRLIDKEDLNKYKFEKSHYSSVQGKPIKVVLNGVDFEEDTNIKPFINDLNEDYNYYRISNQLVINKAGRYIFQAIDTKLADWPIAACLIDVFPEVNTTLSGEKIDGTPEDVILYEGAAPSLNFDMADDNDYNIVVTVDGVSGNSSSVGLYDNAEIKYAVIYGGMKQISLENTLYSVKRPEKTVVNEDGNNYIISSEAGSLLNYRIISKQSAYTAGVDAEPNWIEAQGNTLTIEPSWFGNDINAKVVVEAKAVKSTKKEGYKAEGASTQHTMIFPEALSSINELELDQDEKIEYYDIHGRRITNTAPGLYIRRTSSGVYKIKK